MAEATRRSSSCYGYGPGIRGKFPLYGTEGATNAGLVNVVGTYRTQASDTDGNAPYWRTIRRRAEHLLAKRRNHGQRADDHAAHYWRLNDLYNHIHSERAETDEEIERKSIMSAGTYQRYRGQLALELEARAEVDRIDLELYRLIAPDIELLYQQVGALWIQDRDRDSDSDSHSHSDSVSEQQNGGN